MSIKVSAEPEPLRVKPSSDVMSEAGIAQGETGRVSWFNLRKQFGFVKLEGDRGDAFLHMKVLKAGGYYSLPRGTTVQVRLEPDRGKYKVVELLHVDTSTAQTGEPPALIRSTPDGDRGENEG